MNPEQQKMYDLLLSLGVEPGAARVTAMSVVGSSRPSGAPVTGAPGAPVTGIPGGGGMNMIQRIANEVLRRLKSPSGRDPATGLPYGKHREMPADPDLYP